MGEVFVPAAFRGIHQIVDAAVLLRLLHEEVAHILRRHGGDGEIQGQAASRGIGREQGDPRLRLLRQGVFHIGLHVVFLHLIFLLHSLLLTLAEADGRRVGRRAQGKDQRRGEEQGEGTARLDPPRFGISALRQQHVLFPDAVHGAQ